MANIHKDLRLPSGYKIRVAVDGLVPSDLPHATAADSVHHSLRQMFTNTHGQDAVYAKLLHYGHEGHEKWIEISGTEFESLAKKILGIK